MEQSKLNGIIFDDVVVDEEGEWSQMCSDCVKALEIPSSLLDNAGSGICGVKGCSNESDYYIDFPDSENNVVICIGCLGHVEPSNGNFDLCLCSSCNEVMLREEGIEN